MRSLRSLASPLATMSLAALALVAMLVSPAAAGKVTTNGLRTDGGGSSGVSQLVDGTVGATLTSGKWTLEIPAGAFNGTATVSMVEGTDTDGSPKVDLSISNPALNSFSKPVWLSHKDSKNANKSIYWWDPVNLVWREVPGQLRDLLDAFGVTLKAPLFHFSTYSVKGSKAGW